MVSVRINGEVAPVKGDTLPRIMDLIELIKSVIDPDQMITEVKVDGSDIKDEEWNAPTHSFSTKTLDVITDTPSNYVATKIIDAPSIVQACYVQFRDARKTFQERKPAQANQKLARAVDTFKAFFEWYGTLVFLMPPSQRLNFDISEQINKIKDVCNQICQHQLYQSWTSLSDSIEKDLEPKLDKLEDFCRQLTPRN